MSRGGCCRIGGRRMHEGIDAQLRHGERHDDRCDERSGAYQPLQGGAPALIQAIKRGIEFGIIFGHLRTVVPI